jgi:hypothetical protein
MVAFLDTRGLGSRDLRPPAGLILGESLHESR